MAPPTPAGSTGSVAKVGWSHIGHIGVALALAAIDIYEEDEHAEQHRSLTTAAGGRPAGAASQWPSARPQAARRHLSGAGRPVGANRFRIGIDADTETQTADIDLHRFDRHSGQIVVNGMRHRVTTGTHGPVHLIEVDGVAHRVSRDEGGVLAPRPLPWWWPPAGGGAEVEAGDRSGAAGKHEDGDGAAGTVPCPAHRLWSRSDQVESGAPLLRLEELADGDDGTPTRRRVRPPRRPTWTLPEVLDGRGADEQLIRHQSICAACCSATTWARTAARSSMGMSPPYRAAADGHRQIAAELELIEVFTDLADLTNNGPSDRYRQSTEDDDGLGHVHSAREYFHTYLRSLDVERAQVRPNPSVRRRTSALRHYGVTNSTAPGWSGVPDLPGPAAVGDRRDHLPAAGMVARSADSAIAVRSPSPSNVSSGSPGCVSPHRRRRP